MAVEAAGIDYDSVCDRNRPNTFSRKAVLQTILSWYQSDQPLNQAFVEKNHGGVMTAARRYFHSWANAVSKCGISYKGIRLRKDWTIRDIIAGINSRHKAGNSLNPGIMMTEDRKLMRAGERKFGSWQGALQKAGLKSELVYQYQPRTKDNIISEIQRRIDQAKGVNRATLLDEDPALYQAIIAHFGKWSIAIRRSGFDPNSLRRRHRWIDGEVLELFRREIISGQPIDTPHFKKRNRLLFTAVQHRLGGIRKACKLLGIDCRGSLRNINAGAWVHSLSSKEFSKLATHTQRMIVLERENAGKRLPAQRPGRKSRCS
jgi:hypothetical protein